MNEMYEAACEVREALKELNDTMRDINASIDDLTVAITTSAKLQHMLLDEIANAIRNAGGVD